LASRNTHPWDVYGTAHLCAASRTQLWQHRYLLVLTKHGDEAMDGTTPLSLIQAISAVIDSDHYN
jgi:hypothetical protein